MKIIAVLGFLVQSCTTLFFSGPSWNNLKVGFGINPFSPHTFAALPRTVNDAVESGWKADNSAGGCGVEGTKFNGNRYWKDNDSGAMVLFDKNGFIAGIQAGIPKTQTSVYPGPQNARYHVFNEEKNMWVITAYFTDPSKICTTGRTQQQYNIEGTGTILAIQTGLSADDLMNIPLDESQVTTTTKYVEGKCFFAMGKHYWYNISKDMSCDDTFPVFLMYNGGKLNSFGWAFNPNFNNSYRWEHPDKNVFGMFMNDPPTCLGKDGPVSTLHIYMTDQPLLNTC